MNFNETRETLKQIGLGHNESKIYLTLVKLGPQMAGKIAKESNIDRSACYDSLKALIKKGLVSYAIEANRKKFQASPPEKLTDYLNEKKELVSDILPGLKELYKQKAEKSQVHMYKGYKGIKTVLESIIRDAKGKENCVIDSHGGFNKKMPFYAPHYIKALEKNKIQVRHLVRKEKKPHPSKTTKIKFLPGSLPETIITTNIYSGKIALIIWDDIPEAVIIENPAAYEAYKSYFEILWATAKK